jgi:hypothetical protein
LTSAASRRSTNRSDATSLAGFWVPSQSGSAPHSEAPILLPGWGRRVRHRPGRSTAAAVGGRACEPISRSDRPLLSRRGPFDRHRGKRGHRPAAN